MNVIDLFAGCGGFSTGFRRAGFTIVAAIDNDPAVQATYEHNHPNARFILADVRTVDPAQFKGQVDVIIGSPPCIRFSVACPHPNHDEGMVLVNEFHRWIEVIQPHYWVLENVPPILPYLPKSRYPVKKVCNAADYGVPQLRERCFAGVFGIPRPTHAKSPTKMLDGGILHRWITVSDAIGIGDQTHPLILTDQRGTQSMKGNSPFYNASRRPSRTLTTVPQRVILEPEQMIQRMLEHYPDLKAIRPFTIPMLLRALGWRDALDLDAANTRTLTPAECARLQAFPPEFRFCGTQEEQYRMIGNAVPPLLAQRLAEAIVINSN